jgi:transcriptional regulator with XRE-family HTH domain
LSQNATTTNSLARGKLSRAQLAELIGVEYVTVYRWEKYLAPISYDSLIKIARILGVPPLIILPEMALIPDEEPVSA